ncbi:MAG: hypothetical protein HYV90_05945 [Candidatus Woesebacteria bacterium]|nr:MAG: hypothetical protein HYV90_05945 [Candidatus Woesebacteria bacterium]
MFAHLLDRPDFGEVMATPFLATVLLVGGFIIFLILHRLYLVSRLKSLYKKLESASSLEIPDLNDKVAEILRQL